MSLPILMMYQAIIFAENELLGVDGYILKSDINPNHYLYVDFNNLDCKSPANFGYMIIDLHTAGLKVAEGMLKANKLNLIKDKVFMENNYPAFVNEKYW